VRRAPRDDENAADERRAYRDISDELPVVCLECAEREFGASKPVRGPRSQARAWRDDFPFAFYYKTFDRTELLFWNKKGLVSSSPPLLCRRLQARGWAVLHQV
jgi:hypothetical protein